MFHPPEGAVPFEIITGFPEGTICLYPKIVLHKFLIQSLCLRASVCSLYNAENNNNNKWRLPRCCCISAADRHLGWRCWESSIQTLVDEQSNLHSLFTRVSYGTHLPLEKAGLFAVSPPLWIWILKMHDEKNKGNSNMQKIVLCLKNCHKFAWFRQKVQT